MLSVASVIGGDWEYSTNVGIFKLNFNPALLVNAPLQILTFLVLLLRFRDVAGEIKTEAVEKKPTNDTAGMTCSVHTMVYYSIL